MLKVAAILEESIVDGPGIRSVIFFQGCPRHCEGCHNPDLLPFEGGKDYSPQQLAEEVFSKLTPLHQGRRPGSDRLRGVLCAGRDPLTIKKFTTDIEDATPLGRLFDMDVIRPDGLKVDREELDLEGRRCLICGGPAKVCSSRRIHTVAELQEKTTEILTEARDAQDIADAARLAVRACSTK